MGSENAESGSTGLIDGVAVTRSLRWIVVRGCAVALATLAATTLVGRANAFVYWTESAIGTTRRANLDSSGVNMTFLDAGGLQAACGSLGAYINEVRAQTDKRLDSNQAADLVADATVIRELLGCRAD